MKSSELEISKEYALTDWVVRADELARNYPGWWSVQRVRVVEKGVSYEVEGYGFYRRSQKTKTGGIRIEIVADKRTAEHGGSRPFPYGHEDIVKSASYFFAPWDEFEAKRAELDKQEDAERKQERKDERRAKKIRDDLSLLDITGVEASADGVELTLDAAEELIARLRHAEASVPARR